MELKDILSKNNLKTVFSKDNLISFGLGAGAHIVVPAVLLAACATAVIATTAVVIGTMATAIDFKFKLVPYCAGVMATIGLGIAAVSLYEPQADQDIGFIPDINKTQMVQGLETVNPLETSFDTAANANNNNETIAPSCKIVTIDDTGNKFKMA